MAISDWSFGNPWNFDFSSAYDNVAIQHFWKIDKQVPVVFKNWNMQHSHFRPHPLFDASLCVEKESDLALWLLISAMFLDSSYIQAFNVIGDGQHFG